MLFSATMPEEIRRLASNILTDPLQVTLALAKPADGITQQAYICHEGQKPGIIKNIFKNESSDRVILFASRKTKVKEISLMLKKQGFNVGEMHSDLSQSERDEIMYRYKSHKIEIIVATDILARGIDIDDIRIVINYDVPRDCDDYIHRIGRTARAGTTGRAITFVSEEDQPFFKQIEDFIEQDVPKIAVPEELGEAPAYEPKKEKEKKGEGRNKQKKNNNGKPYAKRGKGKPQKPQNKEKQPAEKQKTEGNGEKQKPKSNHRRRYHRPKKQNGENKKTE